MKMNIPKTKPNKTIPRQRNEKKNEKNCLKMVKKKRYKLCNYKPVFIS